MKKIILYAAILINLISQNSFSYTLTAKNFTYVAPNIIEFDIFIKGQSPEFYWGGQYVFNFSSSFANGGTLTCIVRNNFSDIPGPLRPPCSGVFGNEIRLAPNLFTAGNIFALSTTGDGSRITRLRIETTACSFAGSLGMSWKNTGGYFTKVYDGTRVYDPDFDTWTLTSLTNITTPATHLINASTTNASNVTVSTVPATLPTNYLTLQQAFASINTNSGGTYTGKDVTVNINNSTVETATAYLNAGPYTNCLIKPANANITVTASTCTSDLIVLDGAINVTIDGRVNQTGAVQLTLINTNPGNSNSCIRMINGASNNLVDFVRCNGLSGSTGGTTIAISNTTAGGNNNNRVENTTVTGGKTGIENSGNPGANANSGNVFKSNFIRRCSAAGISLGNGSTLNTIEKNEFKNDVNSSLDADEYAAIDCKAEGTNIIQENKIYDDLINPGNSNYYGIRISSGIGSSTINVYNNFIKLAQNNLKNISGIYTLDADQVSANIYHNTVLITGAGAGTNESFGIYADIDAVSNYNQKNNISVNRRSGGIVNTAVNIISSTNENMEVDYNCYYTVSDGTGRHGGWGSLYPKGLPKYQSLAYPNEKNSVFRDVNFSATDFHLAGSSIGDYELIGTPLPSVTTDLDLTARNVNVPYMGADEASAFSFTGVNAGTIKIRAYIDNFELPRSGQLDIDVWSCNASGQTSEHLGSFPQMTFSESGIITVHCPNAVAATSFYIRVSNPAYGLIEVWSKFNGETFSTSATDNYLDYNFTTNPEKAFGSNLKTCSDKCFIFNGDTDNNGVFDNDDGFNVVSDAKCYGSGYYGLGFENHGLTDLTLDDVPPGTVKVDCADICTHFEITGWFPIVVTNPVEGGRFINRPDDENNPHGYDVSSLNDIGCNCTPLE